MEERSSSHAEILPTKLEPLDTEEKRTWKQNAMALYHSNRHAVLALGIMAGLTVIALLIGILSIRLTAEDVSETFDRLPTDIKPERYNIEIQLNFEAYTFHTRVNISFTIDEPTQYIILNAYDLVNITASISGPLVQEDMPIANPRPDVLRITPITSLTSGDYILQMECDGFISDDLVGLYRSQYTFSNYTTYPYLLVTKFESSYARRVFPCFDEPQFKSIFELSLVGPSSQQYVSNMAIESITPNITDPSIQTVKFEPTPMMSTYSLAFAVGQFQASFATDTYGVQHSIIVPIGSQEDVEFPLTISMDSLDFFVFYFKDFYPLNHLQMLALPDVYSDSIGHWGLVTYRQAIVFSGSEDFSTEVNNDVIEAICRKNAFMWFGNLVTVQWWSELWLNEAFSYYISMHCIERLSYSASNIWTRFIQRDIVASMMQDSLSSAHPVISEISNTDDVQSFHNVISTMKGAALLRMLSVVIEKPPLDDNYVQLAVQRLIQKYPYKAVTTSQFLSEISDARGKNVSKFMQTWISTAGFPVVEFNGMQTNATTITLNLNQRRFFADGSTTDSLSTLWDIQSDLWVIDSERNFVYEKFHLNQSQQFVHVPNIYPNEQAIVKLNVFKTAYFITLYTNPSINSFIPCIIDVSLSANDILDLASDLYMLAFAGFEPMSKYLNFTRSYYNIRDIYVWTNIVDNVERVGGFVEYMSTTISIHQFGQILFGPLFEATANNATLAFLNSLMLKAAGLNSYLNAENVAFGMFDAALTNTSLDSNMREAVFAVNARHRGNFAYQAIKSWYLQQSRVDYKRIALSSMGYTLNEESINEILDMIFLNGVYAPIRTQDMSYVLQSLGISKTSRDIALQYTKDRIFLISAKLTNEYFMEFYLTPLFERHADTSIIAEIESLLNELDIDPANPYMNRLFRQIEVNAAAVARSQNDVLNYLTTITGQA